MKLFTIGPVEMYDSTKTIREKGFVHFRTNEYSEIVKTCLKKLSNLLGNSTENSLIYMAASGTAAMEATVENCITKRDKALVIDGGTFGHRFCQLLEHHKISYESIKLKWDETLTQAHLDKYSNKGFNYLFVNLHETSTGQLYDIDLLSNFCKNNNMYLIVDAISTFLADDYNMDKYGIDLTIISSQKGLCLSPGMSIISFSKKMLDKIKETPLPKSLYFDFKDYLINIPRGQTPFTPPVCVMYELQDMLNLIENNGGKKEQLKTIKNKADYFREKIQDLGLKIPEYPISNMLTPVIFEDISAYEVIQVLKDKYRLFVNPCGGELEDKLLRVSHIGNTTIEDIDYLIDKLLLSIDEVRNKG
ncbi:MAG: aminotransferase class V-fold PLP-dependent enzyme [Candidatus Gastranaerophilales bacterium]|nr:aminotransferase class V-fold PLP-dependent enzyme [Candidatus Gastranaerophilales bacterium]